MAHFPHADQSALRKGVDIGLVSLFEHELMGILLDLMGLQVEHSHAILPGLKYHSLTVIEHTERIHVVVEG